MVKFKLPPISPLVGAKPGTYLKVLWGKKIRPSRWPHIVLSFLVILLITPFQIPDFFYFRPRLKRYKPKSSPLFILGHWRSGTTFLHNILTKDHRASYVTTYHSVFPNHLRVKSFFGIFMTRLMPEKRPGDDVILNVNYPQEDEYALSNMTSCSFYHYFYFPHNYRKLYQDWARFENLSPQIIEKWKKKYLELLHKACINTGGNMAVLKNPVNTGRIEVLLELFPEARFIHIVRNPVYVYCSSKKFFSEVIFTLSFQPITTDDISNMVFWLYEHLMRDYLNDRGQIPSRQLYEIRYEDFLLNPLNEIEKIYKHLQLGGSDKDKADIVKYLQSQESFHTDTYTIQRKELDTILDRWDFAMKTWDYQVPDNIKIVEG